MTTLRQEIGRLRKDYPTFVIVPTRVYDGERVAAYCPDATARDGLYAVIGTLSEVEAELAKAFAAQEARLRTIALLSCARSPRFELVDKPVHIVAAP